MPNDVHVTRAPKTAGIETEIRKIEKHCRISKSGDEEVEYVFGSISPRGGGGGYSTPQLALHKQLPYDVESPDHTQRDTTESDNNISSCSTLDIINKVEHLPVQQLETHVRELVERLKLAEEQRNTLQRQLDECNEEKEMCQQRLEVVSAAHECRLTEMHCVIVELTKKLRTKQDHIIVEEQEPEGSEISYHDGSIYNSELNLTNPDAECQTEPLDDVKHLEERMENNGLESNELKLSNEMSNKGQVEALREEVLHLKAQIALLQSEISISLRPISEQADTAVEDMEGNESDSSLEHKLCVTHTEEHVLNDLNSQIDYILPCKTITSPQKSKPAVSKMAERVKLHCVSKYNAEPTVDLLHRDINNIDVVEHLVSGLKGNNSMLDSFMENTQFDYELQRLQRKVEQLKVRNSLQTLSLNESKEHSDHLYLLCGKYESNAVALQLALNYSDRAIEAYDVMLALLESKLALIYDKTATSEDNRKAVESVARHLLDKLESEKNVCENSLGPWQNTFSLPDNVKLCTPWTSDDDNRLRCHVSKLKGRRSEVQNTIVNLESPFSDLYEKKRLALEKESDLGQDKNGQYDLQMAILMQELLSLRDENLQLKTKLDEIEQDRQHANERINLLQLQIQLTADTNALFHRHQAQENRFSYSEAEHAALTEQQLIEALSRETELKGRIQTLIASVSATQKTSDEKYEQLHHNLRELQKSNYNLGQMLDQNKRKYQQRIRKLEQKIAELKLDSERTGVAALPAENNRFVQNKPFVKTSLHKRDHVPETTL